MNVKKYCLFTNVDILNSVTHINLPTYLKRMAIITVTSFSLLGSQTINAENPIKQLEQLICETVEACQKLSNSIQAQIRELEAKDNLTYDEKKLRYTLNKQLITVEKSETARNSELIDSKLKAQDEKLAELRGALLYK